MFNLTTDFYMELLGEFSALSLVEEKPAKLTTEETKTPILSSRPASRSKIVMIEQILGETSRVQLIILNR